MPTFLADPPPVLYLLLSAAVVVTGAEFARNQDRKSFLPFAAAGGLLLAVYLLDRFSDSPREAAVRGVQEMVAAADARNRDAFVAHIADTFEYRGAGTVRKLSRKEVRDSGFWDVLRQHDVRVSAWDFDRADAKEVDANTTEIGFLAQGKTPDGKHFPMYFRAAFAKQSDGRFRLTVLASYDPVKRTNEPFSIPFFP